MCPAPPRKALGNDAELVATRFLESQGYSVLARNFSTRRGEVDIIAAEADTLCFIEVRARARADVTPPYASITRTKKLRVRAAADAFIRLKGLRDQLCRFDVLSAVRNPDAAEGWDIELLRDAF